MKRNIYLRLVIVTALILSNVLCVAQSRIDADFEVSYSPNFFKYWGTGGVESYTSAVDTVTFFSGKKSLSVKCKDDSLLRNRSFVFYNTDSIPSNLFRGKEIVEISAYVKADSLRPDSYATLFANIRGGGKFAYRQSSRLSSKSKKGWNKLTVTVPVSDWCTSLLFGGIAEGVGKYWFDKFEIRIDEDHVEDIASFTPHVRKNDIKWTNERLIKIHRTDDRFQINTKFYELIEDANVIGLGEATHGTHEFSVIKTEIIKQLTGRSGKVIVAFESAFGSALRINDYIHGTGTSDTSAIIRHVSNPWRSVEFFELIEWMRNYNAAGKGQILFQGFDMQWPDGELDNLALFARAHDKRLFTLVEEIKRVGHGIERFATDRGRRELIDSVTAMLKEVEQYFVTAEGESGAPQKLARHNIDVIFQFLKRLEVDQGRSRFRDSCMAENVVWMTRNFPEHKVILWAHNLHLNKVTGRLGMFLEDRFGPAYKAVGLATSEGSVSVFDIAGMAKTILLEPPNPETYEYWFSRLKYDNWAIDFSKLREYSRDNWLMTSRFTRAFGSRKPISQFYLPRDFIDHFDYLLFIKKTKNIDYINLWAD